MKQSTPKVSVIIPVYNVEKYIERCVDSVLNQTFQDYEVLLIDDGSTDNSGKICDKYSLKDSRIKVFHKENGGVSSARNLGIDSAKGEWICFIDGDDWVKENYLRVFFKNKVSLETIIYQGIMIENQWDNKTHTYFSYDTNKFKINNSTKVIKSKILLDGCPYCKLFNASIIRNNNIKFNERLSMHEDHVFVWEYLSLMTTIITCNSAEYHYMRYNDMLTLSTKSHSSESYILSGDILNDLLDYLIIKIGIQDKTEINSIRTKYGIRQYIDALLNVNDINFSQVFKYLIKKRRNIILTYKSTIIQKILISILLYFPPKLSYQFIKLYRK